MIIAVLGATGVYGRHLIPRLILAGHQVRALVRNPDAASLLSLAGATLHPADIFNEASLKNGLKGCDLIINLATSLPRPGQKGDFSANDRVRREGVSILLNACKQVGVSRILQQSIALVHSGQGDLLATETMIQKPIDDDILSRSINASLEMETRIRQSELDWIILRGGFFYGPGTGTEENWFSRSRAGKLRYAGEGKDYFSLIHIADMAAATAAALVHWPSRETLIVSDDHPAPIREILQYAAALEGGEPPSGDGLSPKIPFRVSNKRAREKLCWAPLYPDFRSGLIR